MSNHKEYSNGEIKIIWKPELCIHCGNCAKGLPQVFQPKSKPWILPDAASTEELIKQIGICPSAALTYEELQNDEDESWELESTKNENHGTTKVEVIPGGPLMVYGNLNIKDKNGNLIEKPKFAAFCRCGASNRQPFCDGAHKNIVFDD